MLDSVCDTSHFFQVAFVALQLPSKVVDRACFHTHAVSSKFRNFQTHRLVVIQVRSRLQPTPQCLNDCKNKNTMQFVYVLYRIAPKRESIEGSNMW